LKQLETLYTIKEASEATGFDQRQIMYKIRRKQIEAQKVGWIWVIPQDSVNKLQEMKKKKEEKKRKRQKKQ